MAAVEAAVAESVTQAAALAQTVEDKKKLTVAVTQGKGCPVFLAWSATIQGISKRKLNAI